MDENKDNKKLSVTIPIEKYEKLLEDAKNYYIMLVCMWIIIAVFLLAILFVEITR